MEKGAIPMQQSYDVVIIGGGVVGSAIARELSRYKLRIAVLEKESDVCTQTSGRNTGMLHAGFLYKTGSLKAICAVEGNQEFEQVARELDVPFKRTGKLIVGFTDEHRQRLEQFMARGEANGVKGLELIDRKRMDELDPSAGGNFAMWCPASGILDPFLYTIALAENAVHNGAEYHLNCAFTGETRQADGTHLLHTTRGDFHTRWVVNSAGLNSAVVSGQLGIPGYVIKPVKGEYFVLDKLAGQFARIPVYPAPNPDNTAATGFSMQLTSGEGSARTIALRDKIPVDRNKATLIRIYVLGENVFTTGVDFEVEVDTVWDGSNFVDGEID